MGSEMCIRDRSEVVHLHYDDISRTNMTIHVRETKGRIDRYTILSQKNLDLLTEYWYKCGRPKDILFPSSWTGGYLDITVLTSSLRKVLNSPALTVMFPLMRAVIVLPATYSKVAQI